MKFIKCLKKMKQTVQCIFWLSVIWEGFIKEKKLSKFGPTCICHHRINLFCPHPQTEQPGDTCQPSQPHPLQLNILYKLILGVKNQFWQVYWRMVFNVKSNQNDKYHLTLQTLKNKSTHCRKIYLFNYFFLIDNSNLLISIHPL